MKWWLVTLLEREGWPTFWVPGYAVLVGVAAIAGAAVVLHLARREGADRRIEATALVIAYVGALLGGYVYEWLRVTPEALMALSTRPYSQVGRAAYGGLLFAAGGAALYLHGRGASVGGFLDRVAVVLGLLFFLVRTGCLLEGCDFGLVTAGSLGVRYPPGSLPAVEHAALGWVPIGAASLPVHLTQLYEGLGALLCSGAALAVRRARRRGVSLPSGAAFASWLVGYAVMRAAVEQLRADAERGLYLGFSTASWTSLAILFAVLGWFLVQHRAALAGRPAQEPA